ncbi:unnamed protein product, partial [marine sediment metagenome]
MKNIKFKVVLILCLVAVFLFCIVTAVSAHFGMVIPSDDMITKDDSKSITLEIKFLHPMEGDYMNMAKPAQFGVMIQGKKINLLDKLQEKIVKDCTAWEANYQVKRPGDYIFYVEPQPYWEPAEDCFIIHYTKVIVNALGLEVGWDEEVNLKTEIIPLTRPYG